MKLRIITAAITFGVLSSAGQSAEQTPVKTGNVTASGACSVIVVGSSSVRINGACGNSSRDAQAFKVLEERLNAMLRSERIEGEKLDAVVNGVNFWFPILSAQIEQVQSNILNTITDSTKLLQTGIRANLSSAEISASFFASAEKKVAGFPLSSCKCHLPNDDYFVEKTYTVTYPNSSCASGKEAAEACVSDQEEVCSSRLHHGYRPWRRVCTL